MSDFRIGRFVFDQEDDFKKDWVFIYTMSHDVDDKFKVRLNGTDGMPDDWRDMILELNSSDLTDDERSEIHTVLFGDEYSSKWDRRTTWHTFVGTYYEWMSHVGNQLREHEYYAHQLFIQYLDALNDVYIASDKKCDTCRQKRGQPRNNKL